jgi:hypothetical protein
MNRLPANLYDNNYLTRKLPGIENARSFYSGASLKLSGPGKALRMIQVRILIFRIQRFEPD